MYQPRLILISSLLSLFILGGGWYFFSASRTPAPVAPKVITTTDKPATTTSKAVIKDLLATPTTVAKNDKNKGFNWQTNARQTYRYYSNVDLKIDTNATLQTTKKDTWQEIHSQLSGILNVRVFDQRNDRIRLGFQLSSVQFDMNGQTFAPLTALFEIFFLVEMSPEGKPLQFHFPRYVNPTNQLFIKEIVNSVQIILPASPTVTTWKIQEYHNTGDYQAHYERTTSGEIRKHKTAYLTVTLQQASEPMNSPKLTARIKQSDVTARLAAPQSWLQTVKGEEQMDFNLPSGKLAEMTSRIQLTLSDDPQDPQLGIWQASHDYEQVLDAFAHAEGEMSLSQDVIKQLEFDKLRQQYANTNLPTLVNRISDTFGQSESISAQEIIPFTQELEEYLTVYPDAALEMPALLETLNPSQTLAAYLIGALEQAGTPQAQRALSTIATNPSPTTQDRAIQAITSFNFVEHPEPLSVDTLWQLANGADSERADTALLALGSVLKNSEGVQQAQIREQLAERLQQNGGRNPAILLKAVGNSADGGLLPTVEPYLTVPQTETRAAAAEALRGFDDPISLNHLVTTLTTDQHQEVRQAALSSLAQRQDNAQVVNTIREYLPREPEKAVRAHLIQFLGKHKADDPRIVETLRQQLTQEQDRQIQRDLYNAIYR